MKSFIAPALVAFILVAFTSAASSFLPEGTLSNAFAKAAKTAYTVAIK